jgi:hypothetical protein
MRELRGEMERLRVEREEWEFEAGRERERREIMEEEELLSERERARNLQDVLGEFQAGVSYLYGLVR